MTTELALMPMADMERLAKAVANSGLFGIRSPEAALVLMAIAQAEGRHPAAAARDYDIINGRPAKKTEAMHRDFVIGGGRIEWHELTDNVADATFHHAAGVARIKWDMARAVQAQLGGRDMWKKYPRQMLRNRCISEGIRTVFPAATSGFYEPGEAGDIPEQPTPRPTPPAASPAPSQGKSNGNGSGNGSGQNAEPDWADLVEKFDKAQARIASSDDARKLLEDWKPGIIAITAIPDGELKRSYLAMRKEVEQQWLKPMDEAAPSQEDINF